MRSYDIVAATLTPEKRAQLAAGQDFAPDSSDGVGVIPSPYGHSKSVQDTLSTIATALWLVAATDGLAGLAVVGRLTRIARDTAADRKVLSSIGWTRADVVRLSLLVSAPALAIGLVAGLVVGVVGSPLASIGRRSWLSGRRRGI